MPLSDSQTFEGFGFGGYRDSCGQITQNQCQKRKIDINEKMQMFEDRDKKIEHHESIPKRHCQWLSQEYSTLDCHQKGLHGEDVNMEEDRDVLLLSEIDASSTIASDQILTTCCPSNNPEILESSTLMDSQDCVSSESPHTSRHTSSTASPWNVNQEKVRRGLKSSPVSRRLYCHCSASWRGMYGIDTGYITDYY